MTTPVFFVPVEKQRFYLQSHELILIFVQQIGKDDRRSEKKVVCF